MVNMLEKTSLESVPLLYASGRERSASIGGLRTDIKDNCAFIKYNVYICPLTNLHCKVLLGHRTGLPLKIS